MGKYSYGKTFLSVGNKILGIHGHPGRNKTLGINFHTGETKVLLIRVLMFRVRMFRVLMKYVADNSPILLGN